MHHSEKDNKLPAYSNVFTWIESRAKQFPNKPACYWLEKNTLHQSSYRHFMQGIADFKSRLITLGLKSGCHIGLVAASSPKWIMIFLSLQSLEVTPVLIDPHLSSDQMVDLLKRSDAMGLLYDNLALATIDDLEKKLKVMNLGILSLALLEDRETDLTKTHAFGGIKNKTLQIKYDKKDKGHTEAFILHTSGTTENFKLVIISQKAVCHAIQSGLNHLHLDAKDIVLMLLPAHHILGLLVCLLMPLCSGMGISFATSRKPQHLMKLMRLTKPSFVVGTPKIYQFLIYNLAKHHYEKSNFSRIYFRFLLSLCRFFRCYLHLNLGLYVFKRLHHALGGELRLGICGGAPLSESLFHALEALGFSILEGYGLTETCALVTANHRNKRKAGTVGVALEGVKLKIRDPDASGCGEVLVKGDMLMQGYIHDDQANKAVLKSGWFYTGDLGRVEKDGHLVLIGRCRDTVVLASGKKVMPQQVESYYKHLVGLEQFILVGISEKNQGQVLYAAAVLEKAIDVGVGSLLDREKAMRSDIQAISKKLPAWWRVHDQRVYFFDSLPVTSTLKVRRQAVAHLIESLC